MQPCADSIKDASGVRPKAAPGGPERPILLHQRSGNRRRRSRRGEPPRRLSGGRCGGSRRQSCAARCRTRRRRCPQSCGHQCTARCGAKCGRAPQERPHECGEHCAGWCASRCAGVVRHPAAHGCTGSSRRRCPQPAQPARASEARSATSAARSAVARRAKRASGIVSGTSARRGVLFGKRSAQRAPASGGDRDCSGNRSEAEIAAESPAAKRVAQIVRMDTRTRIHHRHHRHHHRLHLGRQQPMHGHQQHRHPRNQHRRDRRHRQRHPRRPQHRHAPHIVVEGRESVTTLALVVVNRRVRQAMRRKSGGAAAERGAVGDARSEGRRCGGRGVRPKKNGPRRRSDAARGGDALCGDALHRDAERDGLVDQVVGDARAGERDDALRQEVQQLVVAPERSGPSMCVPVRLAHHLVHPVAFGPLCGRCARRRVRRRARG